MRRAVQADCRVLIAVEPQHGSPLRILDMGETAIDEDTFNEYIAAMREHYTADKVRAYAKPPLNGLSLTHPCRQYHLLGERSPLLQSATTTDPRVYDRL